jgi:hypothetical protein
MPTAIDLTEEQKTWVNEVTQVLTIATPVADAGNRAPHFSREVGARSGDVSGSDARSIDAVEKARRERQHALIVPREHGAWGLLLVPMVTGAGIALRESTNIFPFVLLLTAALTLFWLRTPLESLLKISAMRAETREERQSVGFAVFYLGSVAALALGMLLWGGHNPLLWKIGAAAAIFFAAQETCKLIWLGKLTPSLHMWGQPPRLSSEGEAELRSTPSRPQLSKKTLSNLRMLSEIIGTIGLTAAAPAAYYVITGKFGPAGWILWIANLLFAGDQIHYVQLRIHTARVNGFRARLSHGWAFVAGQAAMTLVLTIACVGGLMPPLASLAFAPLLFRGWFYFIQKPGPLAVRRLGWSELAQAIAFCALFIGTFAVPK